MRPSCASASLGSQCDGELELRLDAARKKGLAELARFLCLGAERVAELKVVKGVLVVDLHGLLEPIDRVARLPFAA